MATKRIYDSDLDLHRDIEYTPGNTYYPRFDIWIDPFASVGGSTVGGTASGKNEASFAQAGASPYEAFYIPNIHSYSGIGVSTNADFRYAMPFFSGRGGTVDRLAFLISVAVAGSSVRVGIYQNTSDSVVYPSARLFDSGEVSTATSGAKSITLSQALDPNSLYWFVLHASHSGIGIKGLGVSDILHNYLGVNPTTFNYYSYLLGSDPYSALPAVYPSGYSRDSATIPAFALRYAS